MWAFLIKDKHISSMSQFEGNSKYIFVSLKLSAINKINIASWMYVNHVRFMNGNNIFPCGTSA